MGLSKPLSVLMIITFLSSSLFDTVVSTDNHLSGWIPMNGLGKVGDYLAEDEEFYLDSESGRRILATQKYISYGALKRNNVPCSRRGASYYNCKKGAQANPYNRGCSKITRCRS